MRLIDADAIPWTDLNADMPNTKIKVLITFADKVNRMPTIEERKTGKWILHIDDLFPEESTMECNQCHERQPVTIDDHYCPNCGAKMEEADEC